MYAQYYPLLGYLYERWLAYSDHSLLRLSIAQENLALHSA